MEADRQRALRLFRLVCEAQRVLEVGRAHVEIAMVKAALDSFRVGLDADRHAAVERDREWLRAAHAPEAGGQRDRARERAPEALSRHRPGGFVRALRGALRPDLDPPSRAPLSGP